MYLKTIFALALCAATPAFAQHEKHGADAEAQAVLDTVDRMFDALAAKDPSAMAAVTIADGRATAATIGADGKEKLHFSTWSEFAGRLPGIPGAPVEKLVDPHVHVEGPIAMIWSPYVFMLDGKLSHCGVNHVDLVKQNGAWRVLNITWTQRKTGCPGQ
ncbi:hypothetical protein [Sphingopyxis panaciterrulae]|uniref:DUF4440 domain-containing protein n=1 Tax=Sphingopyxis panaciterrulae TaxID=462372 RepID=A0A7W9ERP6_9SPHN|nr:hypothetical protein [Sphingopyxis panaciterrulae]MBB5706081.1 hypothetical protein [Sphingopyxis panaciterrulae]